jgi:hypothetical protein
MFNAEELVKKIRTSEQKMMEAFIRRDPETMQKHAREIERVLKDNTHNIKEDKKVIADNLLGTLKTIRNVTAKILSEHDQVEACP